MPVNLTPNAIASINGGDVNSKPLVQVVDIKLIGSTQERYRLLISDSVSTQHAMLATQLNDRVKSGQVKKGSVVQLIDYICSTVQNRKIIVVLNMETILLDCELIGNPKMFSESESTLQKTIPSNNLQQPFRVNNDSTPNPGTFNPQNPGFNSQNPGSFNHQNPGTFNSHNPGSFSTPNSGTFRTPNSGSFRPPNSGGNVQSFRPTVQPPYQPTPNYRNHGPILKNEAPARIIPIAALNPYQGRWAIKARVTAKGDLRRYNNARGDGKVFSFDLLDSDGGEIRVTCFNAVVDRFYDIIEVGRVYLISKGSLKPAQKNFNHLKNEWEIFLEATSTVDLCPEEDGSIPKQQFTFRPISEIESAENNSIVDIIGIVISVNPSVPILRKNGMETQRRTLNLKDTSGRSIEITFWGDFCNKEGQKLQEMVDVGFFPVLAVKAGKVNDFSGKSIGTISSTQLFINPDFAEARGLREWFDQGGKNAATVSISREIMAGGVKNEIRKTVSQIKNEGLGRSEKPDWVTVRAFITFIKSDNFCYTACPLMIGDRQCNKKVTRSGNRWQCDRCNQEFDECDYRYLLQAQIQDQTGLTWVTAFQESGEEILGCPAKELYMLKYELQDDSKFGEIIRSRVFNQYLFRLKIKEELYGDEQRVKITVIKADPVNFSSESRYVLDFKISSELNAFKPREVPLIADLEPPPPSSDRPKSNLATLYYGLLVIGAAAIVLAAYNLIIIKWCARRRRQQQPRAGQRPNNGFIEATTAAAGDQSLDNSIIMNRNLALLSSFTYHKKKGDENYEHECAVCLSVFEEGEEVRRLPSCKHSFHVSCIDMWLYSHFDCPLCRAPINQLTRFGLHLQVDHSHESQEHSTEILLASGVSRQTS